MTAPASTAPAPMAARPVTSPPVNGRRRRLGGGVRLDLGARVGRRVLASPRGPGSAIAAVGAIATKAIPLATANRTARCLKLGLLTLTSTESRSVPDPGLTFETPPQSAWD